jgi:DNA repair exonuclease SbcCD ATPase subunit
MPAMATVETMARSQNELLEAGRAKLAKFQSRNKGKKTGKKAASVADAKIYGNGNPKVETSPQVSSDAHSDAVKGNVDRNGVDVDQPREILFEPDVNRSERIVEEDRRHFVAAELSARVENDEEERRKQREALMERLKRIEQEAEENRQRQREAEEAKRKERERLDAEEARKKALIAEREADEARRKEAEEAKRKERESEQRRQRIIAEITRKKQLEEEEIKRKEREAEEIRRKEREAEESQRRQRDEDEFRKKQREEFASLEQHIQDLTEEKFGLQRELAKARAMSENFVQEHSALVENYNNQVLPLFVMI